MSYSKLTSIARDSFIAYLRGCNMKATPERMLIFDEIVLLNDIFTAEKLHAAMKDNGKTTALATVYNTIDLMVESGSLKAFRVPQRAENLYKLSTPDRSHVFTVCTRCGDIKEKAAKDLTRHVMDQKLPSFTSQSFTLNIYGVCRKCSMKKKQKSLKTID